jgi:hypothetical protein
MTSATIRAVSLVKTFFATFETKQQGLDYLNAELGTRYMHGTLSRWERGLREPDRRTRAVMLNFVLPSVLKKHGKATKADVTAALDKLL